MEGMATVIDIVQPKDRICSNQLHRKSPSILTPPPPSMTQNFLVSAGNVVESVLSGVSAATGHVDACWSVVRRSVLGSVNSATRSANGRALCRWSSRLAASIEEMTAVSVILVIRRGRVSPQCRRGLVEAGQYLEVCRAVTTSFGGPPGFDDHELRVLAS